MPGNFHRSSEDRHHGSDVAILCPPRIRNGVRDIAFKTFQNRNHAFGALRVVVLMYAVMVIHGRFGLVHELIARLDHRLAPDAVLDIGDRKSTRLNSSHSSISYA